MFCFLLLYVNSKAIIPLDNASELTGSVVRSYVTVERPTGGKQIRKATQQTTGKALLTQVVSGVLSLQAQWTEVIM